MSTESLSSRLYVGNLDFNATEEELKELFKDFDVVAVDIPSKTFKRGDKEVTRRLGFGFVQVASEANADDAILKFNGQEFKLRQIYTKKARPPATEEEKKERMEMLKERRQKKAQAAKAAKAAKAAEAAEAKAAESAAEGDTKETLAKPKSKAPRKAPEGDRSKDTVFLTNLDYKTNVKDIGLLFKDLNPVWVKVPTRRVPKNFKKPPFNKGIAFVKFADEETQLKAIAEFNGQEFRGRNVVVDAAVQKEESDEAKDDGVKEVEAEPVSTDAETPETETPEAASTEAN